MVVSAPLYAGEPNPLPVTCNQLSKILSQRVKGPLQNSGDCYLVVRGIVDDDIGKLTCVDRNDRILFKYICIKKHSAENQTLRGALAR